MNNDNPRNSEQQLASSSTAVLVTEEKQVGQGIPATPEIHLPRGVMVIGSLANSFYKVCQGILCVTIAGILGYLTYTWVQGIISTDLYFKIIKAIYDLTQNLVIV